MQEGSYTTEKQIKTRIRQLMYDRKLSGTESNAGELNRLKQQLKDMRREQGVAEVTGDKPFDSMMKNIKKGTKKQATADRREREAASREQARNAFGPSPADRLSIRSDKGVREVSDFGEPREILEDVLRVLEREVEWPLTDIMDPREVKQLLAPIVKAVNDKMMSMEEGRRDYGYDSFGNSLRPGSDEGSTEPPNNFAIYINGKKWKVFQGKGQYADDQYEMQQFRQLQAMAARKSQETGKKWEVARTGEPATK
jgi:hypothetical protein